MRRPATGRPARGQASARRPAPPGAAEAHRRWLQLVDAEGPFLAVPPLRRVWPQRMPPLPHPVRVLLAEAKPELDAAWDAWDQDRDGGLAAYRNARDGWVGLVVREVLGWDDLLVLGGEAVARARASSPDRRVTTEPTGALVHDGAAAALLWVLDPVDSLRDQLDDGWATTPVDRMEVMLRAADVPVGVVTDGRWWALVSAPRGGLAASGVVDALTWVEEPAVRDAVAALLDPLRLVGGRAEDRLPALFAESVLAAEEVTEALGVSVRKAVELVVTAFSDAAEAAVEAGEPDPLPEDADVLVSPLEERLFFREPQGAPQWALATPDGEGEGEA